MSCEEWKNVTLGEVATYSLERISINELTPANYVSTKNMLPEKGGITIAASLPSVGKAIKFKKGCTLISNIRPYFKKIWFASTEGGCSQDVLAIVPLGIEPKYLYYCLNQNSFFDHVSAGAKGTKMPRGDKAHTLLFPILLPNKHVQKAIAQTLSCLDEKIELNNRINKTLEEMAQAIFKSWFIDFEPFQDGEFIDSELGPIPKGWKVGTLGDLVRISSGKRPKKVCKRNSTNFAVPIVGASCIMAFTNKTLCKGHILITGRVGTHGVIQRFQTPCWPSDNTLIIQSNYYEYVYQIMKAINFSAMNRGSTQPLITQTDLKSVPLVIPSEQTLDRFEEISRSLLDNFPSSSSQNKILGELRDTILPKLMSGDNRVPLGGVE